jgi:hypothetical protein
MATTSGNYSDGVLNGARLFPHVRLGGTWYAQSALLTSPKQCVDHAEQRAKSPTGGRNLEQLLEVTRDFRHGPTQGLGTPKAIS